jgi:hypothetical protein
VLDQLIPPADGPAGRGRRRRGGRVGPGQAVAVAVAGDGPGIAFNAQMVTVAAQIVEAEASWRLGPVSSIGTENRRKDRYAAGHSLGRDCGGG